MVLFIMMVIKAIKYSDDDDHSHEGNVNGVDTKAMIMTFMIIGIMILLLSSSLISANDLPHH